MTGGMSNNITHKIGHNLSNSHVLEIVSSTTEQVNNLKSSFNLRIWPNATSPNNHNFEERQNVKTLEKYATENNSKEINVELIVLKGVANNKSLSTVDANNVSVVKDNRISSRKNNKQRIRHGIKSQALEEDVVEKNVITLAKSISLLQNASYNYNSVGAKNTDSTPYVHKYLTPPPPNK